MVCEVSPWRLVGISAPPARAFMRRFQRGHTVPAGRPKEFDLIEASGWSEFPPRLDWQAIFYPVLTEDYATRIARDWNTKDEANGGVGYVLRVPRG